MKKVSGPQVVTTLEVSESPLPAEIQEALGELVGAAREGLLALSVGLGLTVVHELMECEVAEVVGPKGKHDPDRTAKRHGHEKGSMTLGGRRVPINRPRMLVAEQQFRRIIGYRDLAKLVIAIGCHALLVAETNRHHQETRQPVTV